MSNYINVDPRLSDFDVEILEAMKSAIASQATMLLLLVDEYRKWQSQDGIYAKSDMMEYFRKREMQKLHEHSMLAIGLSQIENAINRKRATETVLVN